MNSIFDLAVLALDSLEKQIVKADAQCVLDIDRPSSEVLEISYKDENSKRQYYVLNVRASIEQIWLSSPISGPSHFRYKEKRWVTLKEISLEDLLNLELGKLLNASTDLQLLFDSL